MNGLVLTHVSSILEKYTVTLTNNNNNNNEEKCLYDLVSYIFQAVLEVGQINKGFLAYKTDLVQDHQNKFVLKCQQGLVLNKNMNDEITCGDAETICQVQNLHCFRLQFQNELCGVAGFALPANAMSSSRKFRELIEPLVPFAASNVIGGYLIKKQTRYAQDLFLATMSHEMKTPLNSIIGMSRLLLDCTDKDKNDKEKLEIIHKCGLHLNDLISDILDYSRIRTGHIQVENTDFSLQEAVKDCIQTVQLRALDKNINILVEMQKENLVIVTDLRKFKQILINLLTNAIKYTRTVVSHAKSVIQLKLDITLSEHLKNCLVVQVKDEGIGIPNHLREQVFEGFFQIQKIDAGGVGLGLAICKLLIELLKGHIEILDSCCDEGYNQSFKTGTTIQFSLPVQVLEQSRACLEHKKILVIHSDMTIRIQLCSILLRHGCIPLSCSNLEESNVYIPFKSGLVDLICCQASLLVNKDQSEHKEHSEHLEIFVHDEIPLILIDLENNQETLEIQKRRPNSLVLKGKFFNENEFKQVLMLSSSSIKSSKQHQERQEQSKLQQLEHLFLNVLVVEDNEYSMKTAIETLVTIGIPRNQIKSASDGKEALLCFKNMMKEEQGCDVIFMDLKMPVMDGYEATREILKWNNNMIKTSNSPRGSNPTYKTPKIIALTAYTTEEEKTKCIAAGMSAFLKKPLMKESLEAALEIVLAKKKN